MGYYGLLQFFTIPNDQVTEISWYIIVISWYVTENYEFK